MRRRTFFVAAGVAAGAGAGLIALVRVVAPARYHGLMTRLKGLTRSPADRLRAHYDWIEIDPAAIDTYLADYARAFEPVGRFDKPPADFFTRFLLSTTFFVSDSATASPPSRIAYRRFFDPVRNPCGSPFAGAPPTDREIEAGLDVR